MTDTYGPTSYAPFATWDQVSQSWKTSEVTSLWALTLSSLTLPTWGGLRNGDLCERPTPERLTSGLDFSSLPTPAVNDMGRGKTPEESDAWTAKMQAAHGNGNGHGKSLEIEAQRLLPTPAAHEPGYAGPLVDEDGISVKHVMQRCYDPVTGRLVQTGLTQAVTLLPTPTSQAAKHGETPDRTANGYGSNLWDLPTLLPTPNCMDSMETRSDDALARAKKIGGCANLKDVIPRLGATTAPPSPDGSASPGDQPQHQLSLDELAHPD